MLIPVFVLKEAAGSYVCGDPIAPLIDTTFNPTFSYTVRFRGTDIAHSMLNTGPLDSIFAEITGRPYKAPYNTCTVIYNDRNDRRILKFKKRHPDKKVFILNSFPGYWVIHESGQVDEVAFTFMGVLLMDGTKRVRSRYGQDYVRDVRGLGDLRIGHKYRGCR